MSYQGSVELISGIKQKNNGNFPLVDATAVRVDDETRLSDVLGSLSSEIDTKGTYTKPSTGIPAADLAQAVQSSLQKADSALQSAPVTSVNGQTGDVVITLPTKVSDLTNDTGYITMASVSSDIASKVNISDIDVTLGSSGKVADAKAAGDSINNISTALYAEAVARNSADVALQNSINNLQAAVGTPLVATTASAMTDTSKIYVYTGTESGYYNGNWYYSDGSEWYAGGLYNSSALSTDTTLSVASAAADGKAAGDAIKGVITVSSAQPSDAYNKIWVPTSGVTETEVPTYEEFNDLKSALDEAVEEFAIPAQEAVNNWLNNHPEATTTVQNGSITTAKLHSDVSDIVGSVNGMVQYNVAEIGLNNLVITSDSLVYFPKGTYIIDMDNPIKLSGLKNVKIIGHNATIKLKDQSTIFAVGSAHTYDLLSLDGCSNIEIYGLVFDGNRNNLGVTVTTKENGNCSGIYMHQCENINIHDCTFVDLLTFGIFCRGNGYDITANNVATLRVHNNYFESCMNAVKILEGISNDIIITDNIMLKMDTHGISFYPNASNIIVSNNIIDAGYYGSSITSEAGSGIRFYQTSNVTCSGNIIVNYHQYGIVEERSETTPSLGNNVTIIGNKVLGSGIAGILCRANKTIISDNIIKNFTHHAVYLQYGQDCVIENNIIDASNTDTTLGNIYVEANNTRIQNNRIINATNTCILIKSGYSGSIIYDNEIIGNNSLHTGITIQSPCTVGLNIIKNPSTKYYNETADGVIYTTQKLVYHGNFKITSNSNQFFGTIDELAESIVIKQPCTLVCVEAFIESAVTAGNVRFTLQRNGNAVPYDFAPNITSGKTKTASVKKGNNNIQTYQHIYFDVGDVLTVKCVPSNDFAPVPNNGIIRITFDCDRV